MRKLLIIIIWLTQKAVPKLLEREQAITFKGRYNLVGAAHLLICSRLCWSIIHILLVDEVARRIARRFDVLLATKLFRVNGLFEA
tara:strand:+ start:401 stop:655 length:255 start_codon:yes stop_codon:yes gene_type:complete